MLDDTCICVVLSYLTTTELFTSAYYVTRQWYRIITGRSSPLAIVSKKVTSSICCWNIIDHITLSTYASQRIMAMTILNSDSRAAMSSTPVSDSSNGWKRLRHVHLHIPAKQTEPIGDAINSIVNMLSPSMLRTLSINHTPTPTKGGGATVPVVAWSLPDSFTCVTRFSMTGIRPCRIPWNLTCKSLTDITLINTLALVLPLPTNIQRLQLSALEANDLKWTEITPSLRHLFYDALPVVTTPLSCRFDMLESCQLTRNTSTAAMLSSIGATLKLTSLTFVLRNDLTIHPLGYSHWPSLRRLEISLEQTNRLSWQRWPSIAHPVLELLILYGSVYGDLSMDEACDTICTWSHIPLIVVLRWDALTGVTISSKPSSSLSSTPALATLWRHHLHDRPPARCWYPSWFTLHHALPSEHYGGSRAMLHGYSATLSAPLQRLVSNIKHDHGGTISTGTIVIQQLLNQQIQPHINIDIDSIWQQRCRHFPSSSSSSSSSSPISWCGRASKCVCSLSPQDWRLPQ
jgi:hypothetical protein